MGSEKRWDRALVTGASSGIGEAFARQLGAAGTDLVVVARTEEKLRALADEVRERSGVDVEVLVADLSDAGAVAAIERRAGADHEPVDLVVNNAGYGFSGPFVDLPIDAEVAEIELNVTALVRLTHAALSRMVAAGAGNVINVASVAAFQPSPESATYSATKAFVLSFSQSVHEEVREHGVSVTCLCPGLTRTEFQERGGFQLDVPGLAWQSADLVARSGLDAAARGKPVEVPGWHNKALTAGARMMPMGPVRWASGQVTRRMR